MTDAQTIILNFKPIFLPFLSSSLTEIILSSKIIPFNVCKIGEYRTSI